MQNTRHEVSVRNDVATTVYLAEFRHFPDEPAELRLFTAYELIEFLTSNIEHAHYVGDEVDLVGIWRWDGPGQLTALSLEYRGSPTDDNDYIHVRYELAVRDDPSQPAEIRFSVTIDGRA